MAQKLAATDSFTRHAAASTHRQPRTKDAAAERRRRGEREAAEERPLGPTRSQQ